MRIGEFRQTAFVNHEGQNRAYFTVEDWDMANAYQVSLTVGGQEILSDYSVYNMGGPRIETEIWLPTVQEDTPLEIKLRPFESAPVYFRYTLHPVRPWKVDFIASSHEDLGYCAYVNKLEAECADFLDKAIEQIERGDDYKYMIEHAWWLRGYEKYRDAEKLSRLRQHLNDGTVELNTPQSGIHSHWQGQELLYRGMYFTCVDAAKKYGIQPKSVLFADLSSMSWSALSAWHDMGIRYALILSNPFREATDALRLPPIFRWVAPDGKKSMICVREQSYRHLALFTLNDKLRHYPDGGFVLDDSRAERLRTAIDGILAPLENSPLDRIPLGYYDDREPPVDTLPTICKEMNRRWAIPTFHAGLPTESLSDIDARFGDTLTSYAGDITDQWADFATIAPEWFATRGRAERLLFPAEALTALGCYRDKKDYPAAQIADAVWHLCMFDEHCWATSSKHPQEMHLANMYLVKKYSADHALEIAQGLVKEQLGCYTPGAACAAVYNPLPRPVDTGLRLPAGCVPAGIAAQTLSDGTVLTAPVALPAMSSRPLPLQAAPAPTAAPTQAEVFETAYYRVTVNRRMLQLDSIVDKATGEELIDLSQRFTMGEFVYVCTEGKTDGNLHFEKPHRKDLQVLRGALATEVILTGYEEQSGANTRSKFIFYENDPRIDAVLDYKNAVSLMGDYYDRYKKNIFYALPLKLEGGRFLTELAGGMMQEHTQRLRAGNSDFVVAHSSIAVENGRRGIAVYSPDMPVFHLGGIHYNRFSCAENTESSAVYLYAASNRCNQLVLHSAADCCGSYHLSILPYIGSGSRIVPLWEDTLCCQPLLGDAALPAPAGLTLQGDGLRLLSVKRSENANQTLTVRVSEVCGTTAAAALILPFAVASAEFADGKETATGTQAAVQGNTVSFVVGALSAVTLLITPVQAYSLPDRPLPAYGVRVLCRFTAEHLDTVVCVEKERLGVSFEILEDGAPIAGADCDGYFRQFVRLSGLHTGKLTARLK